MAMRIIVGGGSGLRFVQRYGLRVWPDAVGVKIDLGRSELKIEIDDADDDPRARVA